MNSRVIGRIVALAAVVIGAAAIGIVLPTHDGTNYTVHEIGAPSGYGIDNSNPPTVTVNTNATCSASTSTTSATFGDISQRE